jgi:hypothetical protein
MKRLLALLLLVVAPAFAQELPPIYNPTVEQTYTLTPSQTTSLDNIKQTGTALTLYDDGSTYQPIQLPFDFYYFGNLYNSVYISQNGFISFTSNANGCCSGNQLPFLSQNPYYNMNNSIFAMWSDLADFNTPGNPYYQAFADRFTVGWYGIEELGTPNKFTFEITLFDNSNISIAYGDFNYNGPTGRIFTSGIQGDTSNEFWQIYYGNNPLTLEFDTYLFNTSVNLPPPPPPQFLYWDNLTNEGGTFTLTSAGVVRYGASGVYAYAELEPGTYSCSNGFFGDPIPGVYKSCEFGSNEAPVAEVNCATDPTDPSCIIDSITDGEEPIMLAEETGIVESVDDEEEESIVEELLAAADLIDEIETATEEETLEELLADESLDEEMDMEEELVAEIKELANEEKAATLADSISKDVLETALTVTVDATTSTSESVSSESTKTSSSAVVAAVSESVSSETVAAAIEVSAESVKEETASESSSVAALDILETGRLLGQEALAVTLAGTEASAAESLAEAESIAAVSSSDSVAASAESVIETTAVVASNDTQETQTVAESLIESSVNEETTAAESSQVQVADVSSETIETLVERTEETQTSQSEETLVAEVTTSTQQNQETTVEVQTEEVIVAEATSVETSVESNEMQVVEVQQEQQSAVEFTTVDQAMEVFANNITSQATEQEELENNIIQQAIASAQTEEENKMGFSEAEAVTIANDPALANAFNVGPNTTNLEMLGVLGSKTEEKSDAEIRAEQVVAANKEQQDAINANYMDADQSGILVAIGSDTDVTSYRTAMIRDNNIWYKPEDIYKNIVYKDNVRGSYFLEKGNTDTYKRMVEEQYK